MKDYQSEITESINEIQQLRAERDVLKSKLSAMEKSFSKLTEEKSMLERVLKDANMKSEK